MREGGTPPIARPILSAATERTCSAWALESCRSPHSSAGRKTWKGWTRSPAHLRKWHARGQLERVAHGVYRFPQVPTTPLDPYMLATLWPAGRGVLSHDTALQLHELCDINPPRIHITVPTDPAEYRPKREGGELYEVHHEDLGEDELTWHEGIRIVTPATAIRQGIDTGVPLHLLRQAIDTARRLGRARRGDLDELERALPV